MLRVVLVLAQRRREMFSALSAPRILKMHLFSVTRARLQANHVWQLRNQLLPKQTKFELHKHCAVVRLPSEVEEQVYFEELKMYWAAALGMPMSFCPRVTGP